MLFKIAVGVVAASLCAPAHAQRRSGGGGSSRNPSFEADMSEPADDETGPDNDEDVPAELMSDADEGAAGDADDGRARSSAAPNEISPVENAPAESAPGSAAPIENAPDSGRARPAAPEGDAPTPTSRDAAVARVTDACHVESGLFCDAVRLDDLKTARCLLRSRDDMLPECARALGAAEPYLKP
jgi:hypothetical protein